MNTEELTLAGIDLESLLNRLMKNEKLLRIILMKFTQDTTFEALQSAIREGDIKKAEVSCHTLKGVCGNCSLTKLFELFCEQLRLFRAGDSDAAIAMMNELTPLYENAVTHIRTWIVQTAS